MTCLGVAHTDNTVPFKEKEAVGNSLEELEFREVLNKLSGAETSCSRALKIIAIQHSVRSDKVVEIQVLETTHTRVIP